nr:MAG TPA: hypothetical protein [Myoviridae sp. ctNPX13]
MSIRYGMDAVPGKVIDVKFNEGKKQICFVIEDINGRRLPVSYTIDEEMVLPDRVLTGIMLKESDVPEGHDINLDLIAETIHRVNIIALFARDNKMDDEFNTLMVDCGFIQKDELSITLNAPDAVLEDDDVDVANDSEIEETTYTDEDEYYDTVVLSTTETTFISECIGYPKIRITPKGEELNIEITFATRRFGLNEVNVLLPISYNAVGIIDAINKGIYSAFVENRTFIVDLNLFKEKCDEN